MSVGAGHAWFFCVFLNDDDRGTFFLLFRACLSSSSHTHWVKKKEKIVFLFFSFSNVVYEMLTLFVHQKAKEFKGSRCYEKRNIGG